MSEQDLRGQILSALADIAPEADTVGLDPEKSFRDQIDLDSVDYLQYVLALENKLGIHVPEADYPQLSSVSGALGYLEAKSAAG